VAHSTRRAGQKPMPTARILQHRPFDKPPPHKFLLAFRLDQIKIEKILSKPPRPGKRRDRKRPPKIPPPPIFQPPVPKFPALPTNHLIFPSILTDRENETNAKPYGGILSEADGDTSRSLPQVKDRETFEIARKEAEEERRRASVAAEAEINGETAGTSKPNRTVSGPPSKIKCIQFGKYVIDTFYAAPYPEEYSHESRLFVCEFCLKYLPSEFVAYRHKLKCPAKHPPGDEIYRDGTVSIWEVDGRKKTEYCQCLCLMAKMFLGSKTLYYDVEPFLFYILTEYDEFGYHFVGYFSKEKRPASQNNVSCILVMPIHQRKGYATFLIDFSYLLTRIEAKDGSPEKPLSDMGLTAYRSYWDLTISQHLLEIGLEPFSTKTLMARTGMTADDVIHSLERLYAFTRDPVSKTYAIRYDRRLYENIVAEYKSKKHRTLKPELLVWTPYVMGRSDQAALDGQPMQALAARDGEEDEVLVKNTPDGEGQETKDELVELHVNGETQEEAQARARSRHATILPTESDARDHDQSLVNGKGHVAPGPPSTDALNAAVSMDITQAMDKAEGLLSGEAHLAATYAAQARTTREPLSGYALAYVEQDIPATRFQIDPPIPPSMLRQRSIKKRGFATAFGSQKSVTGAGSPSAPLAVRSSPRNATSVNGMSRTGSPEKVGTPARRSVRKSGLATMETLDDEQMYREDKQGAQGEDEDGDTEGEEEEGDEIEAKLEDEDDEETADPSTDRDDEDASIAEPDEADQSSDEDGEPVEEEEEEDDEEGSDAGLEVEGLEDDDDEDDEDEDT